MSTTISDSYRHEQQELHKNQGYGTASVYFAPLVGQFIKQFDITSLSDYGAGKKRLLSSLMESGVNLKNYFPYDPAFPEYGPARPAELVTCIDVLEHIEPEFIGNVLEDLARITEKFAFFSIHSGQAGKVLTDGRNAHLTQQPASWWLPKIVDKFEPIQMSRHNIMGPGFWVLLKIKQKN